MFVGTIHNGLFGIGILEMFMNLISFHGFTKKKNYLYYYYDVLGWYNLYLAKEFVIIQQNYKNLIILHNQAFKIPNENNIHKSYFIMACYT